MDMKKSIVFITKQDHRCDTQINFCSFKNPSKGTSK